MDHILEEGYVSGHCSVEQGNNKHLITALLVISLCFLNFMPILCQLLALCSSLSHRHFQPHERLNIRLSHWQLESGLFYLVAFQSRIQAPATANGMQGATSGDASLVAQINFCRFADIPLEMSEKKSNNARRISAFHQDKQWVDASPGRPLCCRVVILFISLLAR